MRIVGGSAKGTLIKTLKGDRIRPTSDKVREALFDILYGNVEGATFLDCYAGTGAVGIEALSRGAEKAVFVEKDRKAALIIKENLNKCRLENRGIIINKGFEISSKAIVSNEISFDLIFVDPPYQEGDYREILEKVAKHHLLEKDGILVIEHMKKEPLPEEMDLIKRFKVKSYGQTVLSFYRF